MTQEPVISSEPNLSNQETVIFNMNRNAFKHIFGAINGEIIIPHATIHSNVMMNLKSVQPNLRSG
jgi:hypothetical protein